jgi:hypothetical protein
MLYFIPNTSSSLKEIIDTVVEVQNSLCGFLGREARDPSSAAINVAVKVNVMGFYFQCGKHLQIVKFRIIRSYDLQVFPAVKIKRFPPRLWQH